MAVVGPSEAGGEAVAAAEEVGAGLARAGAVLVCGGLGGVMEAACRGAKSEGGTTLGLLPGLERGEANRDVDVALPTGLGEARNALVVRASDAVVAVAGGVGALSEIALALRTEVPVVGLDSWEIDGVQQAASAADAVVRALAATTRRPADAPPPPRHDGARTFAGLPRLPEPEAVDAVVLGAPFDTATGFRPGARFGPEAVRSGSALLRPWHPTLAIDVFAGSSTVDGGDLGVVAGDAQATAARLAADLDGWLHAGATPVVVGGDHTVLLGELRAHAARHGPLPLLVIDAHTGVGHGERLSPATVIRQAVEEELVDPRRSLLAGARGPLDAETDLTAAGELGFEVVTGDELRALGAGEYSQRVLTRTAGAPCFLSFDMNVIDPAFAPGTGSPEVAGLLPHEALTMLRSLAGTPFAGFDVVEVAPPYDGPGQTTSMLAANIVWELLALRVVSDA